MSADGTKGPPKGPISDLKNGFMYPFRGMGMILRNRVLLAYAAIPTLINTVLFAILVWVAWHYFGVWLSGMIPEGDAWYWTLITVVAWILFPLLLAAILFFTFTAVGNLIASPFNDLLAGKTEEILAGPIGEEPISLKMIFGEINYTVKGEAVKLVYFLIVQGLLLLINLIPIAGQVVYAVVSPLFTLFWLALAFADYIFARHHLSFSDKRRVLRHRPLMAIGFGAAVFCILFIPLLNLALLGTAVVGATMMVVQALTPDGQSLREAAK